jgi:hypothetical protein
MRLLRVALLELRDKALLLVVGLIGGLSAIGIPLLRGVQGPELASQQAGIGMVLAIGTVAVTALLLGSGLAGPDLQEGRLGFYFARPLRAFDLWGGRFLAAIGINQLGGLLCILPALLYYREFEALAAVQGLLLLLGLAGLLLANAASIALRARTAWLILDFAALLAFGWGWIRFVRRIDGAGAGEIFPETAWVAIGILLALLLLAGFIGFAMGRVNLPKGHRAASLTFAGGVLAALAASAVYLHIALGVKDVRSLKVWHADAGDRGPWCIIGAEPDAKRLHGYLLNTDTREAVRINRDGAVISQDGRRAAWLPGAGLGILGLSDIWVADLQSNQARVWSLRVPKLSQDNFRWENELAINATGDRLAVIGQEAVAVLSLESGAVLARHSFPDRNAMHGSLGFLSNGDLRIYACDTPYSERPGVIYEVRFDEKRLVKTGELLAGHDVSNLNRDPVRETLLFPRKYPSWRGPLLLDARTGQLKKELSSLSPPGSAAATFLPDGRIACLEASSGEARLRMLDAEGVHLWETLLVSGLAPRAKDQYRTRIGWDPLLQRVLAKVEWGRYDSRDGRLFLVDPFTQTFVEFPGPKRPERSLGGFRSFEGPVAPDSFQASLRITEKQQLVRVAPDGSRKVLMGPE